MNLEQFKNWAVSQGQVSNPVTRQDWLYTGQCVSLVQQYINKVYGIPFQARGNAKDWATNANVLSYFDKVGDIRPGDIIVYPGSFGGGYGHIAIALGNGQMLDQNGDNRLRVAIRPVWGGYSAILRRKGVAPQQGDIMDTNTGHELYRTALHREPESQGAAGQWNGRPARDALIVLRSAPEWQTIDTKVKAFDSLQAKVNELSKNPTKAELDAVVAQLKAEQDKVKSLEDKIVENQDQAKKVGAVETVVAWIKSIWSK